MVIEIMRKVIFLSVMSIFIAGCTTSKHEKSRDFESAKTLQQKRDVLLKWGQDGIASWDSGLPSNAIKARNEYLKYKNEDEIFLKGLVDSCYNSTSNKCAYNYYLLAIKSAKNKESEIYKNERDEIIRKGNAELLSKVKTSPGDSFKCKLSISLNSLDEIKDSGTKVIIKDDGYKFIMYKGSEEQIQSPTLKEKNDGTGLRVGFSDDGLIAGIASYDGDFYQINLRNEVIRKRIYTTMVGSSIPYLISDTKEHETAMVLYAFGCKKFIQ